MPKRPARRRSDPARAIRSHKAKAKNASAIDSAKFTKPQLKA